MYAALGSKLSRSPRCFFFPHLGSISWKFLRFHKDGHQASKKNKRTRLVEVSQEVRNSWRPTGKVKRIRGKPGSLRPRSKTQQLISDLVVVHGKFPMNGWNCGMVVFLSSMFFLWRLSILSSKPRQGFPTTYFEKRDSFRITKCSPHPCSTLKNLYFHYDFPSSECPVTEWSAIFFHFQPPRLDCQILCGWFGTTV